MALSERGRVLATTSVLGQVAGTAVALRRGNGFLVSLVGGLIGGFAGLFAGHAYAEAQHLTPGLMNEGPDADTPANRQTEGSEIDGFVAESQRPYYDMMASAKAGSENKFQPIAFIRTTPAPSLVS